jgi:Domain of unknown function (DUF4440)
MPTPMESFFRTFEQLSAESNAADLAGLYAPSFLLAGPSGSQLVRAADLQHAIGKRKDLFKTLGCTSTHLATLQETVLDDRYSLVRTEWHWRFERSFEALVEFTLPSSYVIERAADRWQIVAYIPHADIMEELRRRGLLAAGA